MNERRKARIVVATRNRGKLREFAELLPDAVEVVSLADLGIESPPETGQSFLDNAIIKAEHASKASGLPALADDSGLEVEALNGAPGIRSARFAGPDASDEENNRKLIHLLSVIDQEPLTAKFVSAIAFSTPDGFRLTAEDGISGKILREARGTNGFGYDPLFLISDPGAPKQNGRTMAELSDAEKNHISHRRRAFDALLSCARRGTVRHAALGILTCE